MHISAFGAALRTPDLRKKILFTLGLLALYRLGSVLPTPGVDYSAIQRCIDVVQDNSVYALINLFSGGALLQLSVFALGIMPYITASIIIQLLTVVIPRLESLRKEGQAGQAMLTQYTRYLTVGLAILQSTGIVALARVPGRLFQGCDAQILPDQSILLIIQMIFVMTAGTAVIMWLGELITDRGVGNGMSLLIFTSIIATFPGQLWQIATVNGPFTLALVVVVGIGIIAGVVYVEQAQRRIPVQYAKRMVGRRMYGGTSTYIPLKVNMAGVIPVIFASSLLYVPTLIIQLSGSTGPVAQWLQQNFQDGTKPLYVLVYGLLIIFFTYFYVAITFNPVEVADNMKQYGGFIPGIRAGSATSNYLSYVMNRLNTVGAVYLLFVALIPTVLIMALNLNTKLPFGGTTILIIAGVGLDTLRQAKAQTEQFQYAGFLFEDTDHKEGK